MNSNIRTEKAARNVLDESKNLIRYALAYEACMNTLTELSEAEDEEIRKRAVFIKEILEDALHIVEDMCEGRLKGEE